MKTIFECIRYDTEIGRANREIFAWLGNRMAVRDKNEALKMDRKHIRGGQQLFLTEFELEWQFLTRYSYTKVLFFTAAKTNSQFEFLLISLLNGCVLHGTVTETAGLPLHFQQIVQWLEDNFFPHDGDVNLVSVDLNSAICKDDFV